MGRMKGGVQGGLQRISGKAGGVVDKVQGGLVLSLGRQQHFQREARCAETGDEDEACMVVGGAGEEQVWDYLRYEAQRAVG